MSEQPPKRKVLFDDLTGVEGELSAAARGEMSLGTALACAREARGLTLSDVAHHLRIREPFLLALEQDDHAHLPGTTYAIGFIRSYAEFLDLDGEEAVAIFKAARDGTGESSALNFPEPVAESRIPRGAVLFISVILAAGAYGGWYYLSSHDMQLADLVPEVPASLRVTGETAPATTASPEGPAVPPPAAAEAAKAEAPKAEAPPAVAVSAAPERTPAAEATPAPASEAAAEAATEPGATPPPEPVEPAAAEAASEPDPKPVAPAAAQAAPAQAPEPAPARPQAAERAPEPAAQPAPAPAQTASAPAGIEIHAKADSWVQIRGPGGRVVVMRIFRKGDTYQVPDEKGLTLMTGNAGAIEIRVGGETVPPIGPFGAVRRDVALDAVALKAGTATPR